MAPRSAWMIDTDYTGAHSDPDDTAHPPIFGPSGITDEQEKILRAATMEKPGGNVRRFRLLNGDKDVDYSGWQVGPDKSFRPLDDFGRPDTGSAYIEYLNTETGEWEEL